ncbi:hypothetical protein MMPV_008543 [Pyropia vietnamensis]
MSSSRSGVAHSPSSHTPSVSSSTLSQLYAAYSAATPPGVAVVDAYLAYVLATGVITFAYAAAVGTFPFNAFLGAFLSAVGSFVLGVGLRMQLAGGGGPVRALADWLVCQLVLHLAVLNFVG